MDISRDDSSNRARSRRLRPTLDLLTSLILPIKASRSSGLHVPAVGDFSIVQWLLNNGFPPTHFHLLFLLLRSPAVIFNRSEFLPKFWVRLTFKLQFQLWNPGLLPHTLPTQGYTTQSFLMIIVIISIIPL